MTNAGWGALGGAAVAGLALLVGVGRIILALVFGGTMQALSWSDARMLAFYVGSFVLAGALVGALLTFLHGKAATFVAMALGGVIVMCSIAVADSGTVAMSPGKWIAAGILGIMFGCATAYGWVRAR